MRGDALADSLSRYLLERVEETANVHVLARTEVVAMSGDDWLRTLTTRTRGPDGETSEEERDTHALFICTGGEPRTAWARERGVACDERGYRLTGADVPTGTGEEGDWPLERPPDPWETSFPRLHAIGDVRHDSTTRVAVAMADGALVVKAVMDRLTADPR